MIRNLGLVLVVAAAFSLAACARPPSPMLGILSLDIKAPMHVDDDGKVGPKTGTACIESVLGWVTKGDASLEAAMKQGGITKIDSVDYMGESMLGITGKFCTIVHGS